MENRFQGSYRIFELAHFIFPPCKTAGAYFWLLSNSYGDLILTPSHLNTFTVGPSIKITGLMAMGAGSFQPKALKEVRTVPEGCGDVPENMNFSSC
jgi:hypothetical protein